MVHIFERAQELPISLSEAWAFLSDPRNLCRITPPNLNFKIVSEVPGKAYAGLILRYTVTPIFGIPLTWVSEITHLREPNYFVDEQIFGPYKYWHHEHEIIEAPRGVLMRDRITLAMRFGVLGNLAYALFVKRQLEAIFEYRRRALDEIFSETP